MAAIAENPGAGAVESDPDRPSADAVRTMAVWLERGVPPAGARAGSRDRDCERRGPGSGCDARCVADGAAGRLLAALWRGLLPGRSARRVACGRRDGASASAARAHAFESRWEQAA